MAEPKRRLPVVASSSATPPEGDADEARPAWQWSAFGTVAIFGAWVPLSYVAQSLVLRVIEGRLGKLESLAAAAAAIEALPPDARLKLEVLVYGAQLLAMVLALLAGGFLVGRWGGRAGVREAAAAGGVTMLVVAALMLSSSGFAATSLAVLAIEVLVGLAIAIPVAGVGGWLGLRRRRHRSLAS